MNKLPWARFAAEFGVIVVGVLVALLAESAWQERGERSDEPEVLERISAELGLDSAIILDDVDWFGQLVPILEEARAVLRGESDLTPGPALAVVFTAGLRRTDLRDPRTSTHEMGVLAFESVKVYEDMVRAQRSLREVRDTLASVR
jgi:hypothetical protein